MNTTILYIGGFELPDKNAAAHRVLNNSKILRELGYEVIFHGIYSSEKTNICRIDSFENYPRKYPNSKKEWIHSILSVKKACKIIEEKNISCVVLYNCHLIPTIRIQNYCKKRNIKVVADVSEWYENSFSFLPERFVKYFDTLLSMRWAYRRADGMIAISSFLYNYYKPSVKNIVQIPPLVDVSEPMWNEKCQRIKKPISFIYTGTIDTKDKDDLGVIVDSFADLNSYEYVLFILGVTKEEFIDAYPDREESLKSVGNKLHFLGRVSHEKSIRMLRECNCCIFIRKKTRKNMAGFPTKFVECATANTYMIASDISNIKDYTDRVDCLLINSCEKNEIRNAIKHVIDQDLQGREEIRDIFDYKKYLNILKKLFEDIEVYAN